MMVNKIVDLVSGNTYSLGIMCCFFTLENEILGIIYSFIYTNR